MRIGHDKLVSDFKRLADEGGLFHAYLFVGEKGVGKFSFALSLANYLEKGSFDLPGENKVLGELLIVRPEEKETIGIDQIRRIRHFLSEKPVLGSRRLVVIDQAEALTDQAGNALLKVLEEPPESGLLVLVAESAESVFRTIRSRSQVVYFGKAEEKDVASWLIEEKGLKKAEAEKIAALSFGKPGIAARLSGEKAAALAAAEEFLASPARRSAIIRQLLDEEASVPEFLEDLILLLRRSPQPRFKALRAVTETMTRVMDYNVNKRLQLEAMAADM